MIAFVDCKGQWPLRKTVLAEVEWGQIRKE